MSTQVRQQLNDIERMRRWQLEIGEFDLLEPTIPNQAHRDYLEFYKLLDCTHMKDVRYHGGFRQDEFGRIFHQYFEQANASEVILIVHGYTDHGGLFAKLIRHLLQTGRSVIVYDQLGHGLSSGERATIARFETYIAQLQNYFPYYQTHLKQPLHIIGQSMGGSICMSSLLEGVLDSDKLGKVILLAPLVRPRGWRQAVWTLRLFGWLIKSVQRKYKPNSEDQAFSRFVFYEDPVQHNRLPAQWVSAMLRWEFGFNEKDESDFPLWVIQGDNDQTVDWVYNLRQIKKKFPKAQICMVPEAGHHLAGESERLQKQIFEFIEQALES